MGKIVITSKLAIIRHKDQCNEFLKSLRASKTKSKDVLEKDFKYCYYWAEKIVSQNFQQILSGKDTKEKKLSIEERISKRIERSVASLVIKAGRVQKYYNVLLPEEVKDIIREAELKHEVELKRIDALTPEEKQAEVNNALRQLSKSPGFIAFKIQQTN